MPDLVTHYCFGEQVSAALPAGPARALRGEIFGHATAGPDVWFSCGFAGGRNRALAGRGDVMHEQNTGAFLLALAQSARTGPGRDELFSYLAGFLCHYCLDRTAHPYIVCKTGNYDGTAATLPYRGAHMRLERAIDSWVIRRYYGGVPGLFSLPRRVLKLRRLPERMRTGLESAYASVYGWTGAWEALNAAIRDQRLFYALVQDPAGLLNAAAPLLDDGKSPYDYRVLSYRGRDLDGVDFLNAGRAPWHHPCDPSLVSRESFPDLFERARTLAVSLTEEAWRFVYLDGAPELAEKLGNASYSTGLPCGDPRNAGPLAFEPLF